MTSFVSYMRPLLKTVTGGCFIYCTEMNRESSKMRKQRNKFQMKTR